jgi:flagellar FliL protein
MFERDKINEEIKAFDIDLSTNKQENNNNGTEGNKKLLLIVVLALVIVGVSILVYYKFIVSSNNSTNDPNDLSVVFIPMEEITVNLRQGVENNTSWLKIRVTLEVHGKSNGELVKNMLPKIVDIFQTYLKELRKSDLDGSFGIYKIKDEMMLRINTILYPAKIEGILFQDFMMQEL